VLAPLEILLRKDPAFSKSIIDSACGMCSALLSRRPHSGMGTACLRPMSGRMHDLRAAVERARAVGLDLRAYRPAGEAGKKGPDTIGQTYRA
jgi:hypothetical protein